MYIMLLNSYKIKLNIQFNPNEYRFQFKMRAIGLYSCGHTYAILNISHRLMRSLVFSISLVFSAMRSFGHIVCCLI